MIDTEFERLLEAWIEQGGTKKQGKTTQPPLAVEEHGEEVDHGRATEV